MVIKGGWTCTDDVRFWTRWGWWMDRARWQPPLMINQINWREQQWLLLRRKMVRKVAINLDWIIFTGSQLVVIVGAEGVINSGCSLGRRKVQSIQVSAPIPVQSAQPSNYVFIVYDVIVRINVSSELAAFFSIVAASDLESTRKILRIQVQNLIKKMLRVVNVVSRKIEKRGN